MHGCESWTIKKVSPKDLLLSNCGAGEDDSDSPLDSVLSLLVVCDSLRPHGHTPDFPVLHSLPVFSNSHPLSQWYSQSSHPLSSPSPPPSILPSIGVFSNKSALCIRWPKYWSFSFNISPSNEYSGLISFNIDWFDLLAVHWTLKSLLQPHGLKASILWCSACFMVQLSHPRS